MKEVTLHEEMVWVLKRSGGPMTSRVIADEVNRRAKYLRRDGEPVPAGQIRARANNYQHIFRLYDREIGLVSTK